MDIETFREHCMAVKGATESTPFLDRNMVAIKVVNKMFCMFPLEPKDRVFRVDLKCDPERSAELRARYWGVTHGHVKESWLWNRITLDSDVPDRLIIGLISHAVEEVVKKMTRAEKETYNSH